MGPKNPKTRRHQQPRRKPAPPAASSSSALPSDDDWYDMDSNAGPRRTPAVRKRFATDGTDRIEFDYPDPSSSLNQKRSGDTQTTRPPASHDLYTPMQAGVSWVWAAVARPLLGWVFGVFGMTMHLFMPVFSLILGAMLVVWFLNWVVTGYLPVLPDRALSFASQAVCKVPFVSQLPVCDFRTSAPQGPPPLPELVQAQGKLDTVLSAASSELVLSLPYALKGKEMALRDVRYLVEHSHLPSRESLAFEIDGFVKACRQAGTDLGHFNSLTGRVVDGVLTTNQWTLSTLREIEQRSVQHSQASLIGQALHLLNPFAAPPVSDEKQLSTQYAVQLDYLSDHVSGLVMKAQVVLKQLEEMDDRLSRIQQICAGDNVKVRDNKAELFREILVYFGAKSGQRKALNNQLQLLGDIDQRRSEAVAYLNDIIIKLGDIGHSLEDLRARTQAPMLDQASGRDLPIRLYIENTQLGLERLQHAREKSRLINGEFDKNLKQRIDGRLGSFSGV